MCCCGSVIGFTSDFSRLALSGKTVTTFIAKSLRQFLLSYRPPIYGFLGDADMALYFCDKAAAKLRWSLPGRFFEGGVKCRIGIKAHSKGDIQYRVSAAIPLA